MIPFTANLKGKKYSLDKVIKLKKYKKNIVKTAVNRNPLLSIIWLKNRNSLTYRRYFGKESFLKYSQKLRAVYLSRQICLIGNLV